MNRSECLTVHFIKNTFVQLSPVISQSGGSSTMYETYRDVMFMFTSNTKMVKMSDLC